MGKKAREKAGKKAATVGIVGNIFLTVLLKLRPAGSMVTKVLLEGNSQLS